MESPQVRTRNKTKQMANHCNAPIFRNNFAVGKYTIQKQLLKRHEFYLHDVVDVGSGDDQLVFSQCRRQHRRQITHTKRNKSTR